MKERVTEEVLTLPKGMPLGIHIARLEKRLVDT
jgi:hypothetical protein